MPPSAAAAAAAATPVDGVDETERGILFESDAGTDDLAVSFDAKPKVAKARDYEYVWISIVVLGLVHVNAAYGLYLVAKGRVMWQTIAFAFAMYLMAMLGITAGSHRQWSHRSYKAKWPLRVILMIFQTIAFQHDIIDWSRDHRMHHKYLDTDADPHSSARGFFFCHMGWLLVRKHPDIKEKGKGLDMSDLYADPILRFQKNYYRRLVLLFCIVLPTLLPYYGWHETYWTSWSVATMLRLCCSFNAVWLVNSAAHLWGWRPYDKHVSAAENIFTGLLTVGEGSHNYHHVFPWDYKTGELRHDPFNFTTLFIETFAKIGWAYDMKTVAKDVVARRVARTGDGTHKVWGWGDKDLDEDERLMAKFVDG